MEYAAVEAVHMHAHTYIGANYMYVFVGTVLFLAPSSDRLHAYANDNEHCILINPSIIHNGFDIHVTNTCKRCQVTK